MDDKELLVKYQALLKENDGLRTENKDLRAKLGIFGQQTSCTDKTATNNPVFDINQNSLPEKKVQLFMSLFRGRDDVYARRWQNREGKSGYAPVCRNEWKTGLCGKPRTKCADCAHKSYQSLDETAIQEHLKGKIVAGIYPMLLDETCFFLAIDFDDEGWQKDIAILRDVCRKFSIPVAVERSRSGHGAHAWFFFEDRVLASLARKLGTAILTFSMSCRHEITFKSYDRFFPNQDTMPKGGLGNLIALPLQMVARKDGNSVFLNENLEPYVDQWKFLSTVEKLHEDKAQALITEICHGNELGILKKEDEDECKPWEIKVIKLSQSDFHKSVSFTKANMLYILKDGISHKALNVLKRLAAFKNPEYYKAQAMRMPTYNQPRVTMYHRRLNGYAAIGYKVRGENVPAGAVDIIFDTHSFLPVCCNDIINALREVVIVSPYVTKRRVLQMSQTLQIPASKQIKVIAITRPIDDYKAKDEQALVSAVDILKQAGVQVVFQSNIHQKFAVIDQRLVWYGSINLLSFGNAEESMMRLESSNIANELLSTIL